MSAAASPDHTFKSEPMKVSLHAARRVAVAAGVVSATALAIAAGYALWHGVTPYEATDNAYVRGDLTFVAARTPGYIVEVATENNRRVTPGQVLARIDPRDYEAAVRDAEATVAQQRAAGLQLKAQEGLQQAQIAVADAAIAAARAQAVRAAADFGRSADLIRDGGISHAQFDASTSEDARADAGLTQSRAQASYARRQLDVLAAQRAANLAALQGAEAKLFKARNDLAATVITAPREGLVAARNIRVGEFVGVGTRLMAVAPTRQLWIEANLRETQFGRVRAGDRVQIRVDAFPGRTFCGAVESLSAASGSEFSVIPPDNATGNFTKIVRRFPIRILFDPGQTDLDRLGSGMSVEPRIAVGSHADGRAHAGFAGLFAPHFACAQPHGGRHA
jgi:membrane fusion protein (multidrug efflux system)